MTIIQRFATIAALLISSSAAQAGGIEIHDQYAISGANPITGAAFMVIHNHGLTDDHLIGVRSDLAAVTQVHDSSMTADGVMSMSNLVDGVDLPAGGEILLERGAKHIMFMGLAAPFEQGQEVVVYLDFEVAGEVVVTMVVDNEATPMDHDEMDQATEN